MWGEDTIQSQLQDCSRNQKIFVRVARELNDAGFERTYQQCRDKIKNLKIEYKKLKDKHGKTGEDRTDWEYFNVMDAIMGNRPATKPPIVIATSTTSASNQEEEEDELDKEKEH